MINKEPKYIFLIATLFCALAFLPKATFADDKNQLIKAISVYKLLNYVGFSNNSIDPEFCYTADDKFNLALKKINRSNRSMKRFSDYEIKKHPECNIIYFEDDTKVNLMKYVKSNEKELLISDRKNFVKNYDGIIELAENKGKIGFILNLKKAKRVGINISSKLIESAQKIY